MAWVARTTAIAVHDQVRDSFRRSMIVPIPKGHVNKSDSAKFGEIALNSIFLKMLDNIFLDRCHVQLMSCDRQFGFKPKSSTNLCSMVLKETVAYYVQSQNPAFCTSLHSTWAFDTVNYCKLFKLLVKRKLPVLIIRVLANLYMNYFFWVSWGGAMTDYFTAFNGVKQGAELSPFLHCVYVDDLLYIYIY